VWVLQRLYAGFCGILAKNPVQQSHSRTHPFSCIAGFSKKKGPQSVRTQHAGFLHDILTLPSHLILLVNLSLTQTSQPLPKYIALSTDGLPVLTHAECTYPGHALFTTTPSIANLPTLPVLSVCKPSLPAA
jgi:hypothetical protein